MLEGSFLFKKFSTNQSLKKAAFDPLTGDAHPPESCGYGMRQIKLHPNLDRIEIKHAFKPGTEMNISLGTILRPLVPQVTMDVLKVQKKMLESHQPVSHFDGRLGLGDIYSNISSKPLLMPRGVNSSFNLDKYANCSYYPFSILLEKGGRIDLVAPNYGVFKDWINGLNFLLKNRKNFYKISKKIKESCL